MTTIDLSSKNKDQESVLFSRTKPFLESFGNYIQVMKFGHELAESGYIDSKSSAPAFGNDLTVNQSRAKSRFNAIIKAAIRKHKVFSNPDINYSQYDKKTASHGYNGRFIITGQIKASVPLMNNVVACRLDKDDKRNFIESMMISSERSNGVLSKSSGGKERIKNGTDLLIQNYDVFLLPNLRGQTQFDLSQQFNGILQPIINPYLSAGGGSFRFNPIAPSSLQNHGQSYRISEMGFSAKAKDGTSFITYLASKYLSTILTKSNLDEFVNRFKDKEDIEDMWGTSTLVARILENYKVSVHDESLTKPITSKAISDTNYIFSLSMLGTNYLPALSQTQVIFGKRFIKDEKTYVDLDRFDIEFLGEIAASNDTMQNPKRFMELHNKLNSTLEGFIYAKEQTN